MPANLPPQYFEAEKKLKTAKTAQEKMSILEELLSIVPKHKGTEKLQALLKTKISKLKNQSQKKAATSKQGSFYCLDKAGAGQVVLVGLPNSGKSMLVKSLTNANPEIGNYPFTTHTPAPAMIEYENIQIQLIDTPPITPDYMESWYAELIKGSDGVLILLDLTSSDLIEDFLIIQGKLEEKRIKIISRSQNISADDHFFWKRSLIVANKKDLIQAEVNFISLKKDFEPDFDLISISASQGGNINELKKQIFALLQVVRVYSKTPGKKVELKDPFVFKKGSSLTDMAKAVHKDFAHNLKFARIWGKDKYQGQKVNRDYILKDEDVIELHI